MHETVATPTRRDRRVSERRSALARTARELTIRHGFSGFTVEELCEEAGVSRRTFFNYFPSKEYAIVGRPEEGLDDESVAPFLARRPGVTLLEDLVDLGAVHFAAIGLNADSVREFVAVADREPKLLQALLDVGTQRDLLVADLVARREGLDAADPAVLLAVQTAGTVIRSAVGAYLDSDGSVPLERLARDRIAAVTRLLLG
ncbi:TetR/AcrR family transcriptional regulator [Rathayibacter sp. VKM Ac-2760]|uniref:TetR/AcrR family transcriptional regulator n=1 Tax=Rathayibacter sp. VKM Ac-2760 TaxID=2609253 RepID=UPI001FC8F99E|nr:TetR/AcrR family transcriptional regulator [Rathayibacter sp. VKM Ac-2760]